MKKSDNILNKIRIRNGYSIDDFAAMLGVTKTGYYHLLTTNKPLQRKYYEKIEHLLSSEDKENFYNNTASYVNSIINQNQTNCCNYNTLIQNNAIVNVIYYNNLIDCAKQQNQSVIACSKDVLQVITNNAMVNDISKINICKYKDKTVIIDTVVKDITSEENMFVIKNEIQDNTTAFIATVNINALTGKITMKLQDGTVSELLNTCEIIGKIIAEIRGI